MKLDILEIDNKQQKEKIMVGEIDLKYIDRAIDDIENDNIDNEWNMEEYMKAQIDQMRKDPNRHITAIMLKKKDDDVSDSEMGENFVKEDKYGFSFAFLFALRNEKYRKDVSKNIKIDVYRKMKKQIEAGIEKHNKDNKL